MLQHVSAHDHVIAVPAKQCLEVGRIQIGHQRLPVPLAGNIGLGLVQGDSVCHQGMVLAQILPQAAGTHAQVKQRLSGCNEPGNEGQGILVVANYGALVNVQGGVNNGHRGIISW